MAIEDLTFNDIAPLRLAKLKDGELLAVHASFMRVWQRHEQGQDLPEGLNQEEFLNRFAFVVSEFSRREDLERPSAGNLDEALSKLGEARMKESLDALGKCGPIDVGSCEKLFASMPDELIFTKDFVRFGGDLLTTEDGEGLIEAYIKDGYPDSQRDLKLMRLIHRLVNREASLHLCPEGHPDEAFMEGFDLVLRKRQDFNLNIVAEPELQAMLYGSSPDKLEESVADRRRRLSEGLVDFVVIPSYVSVTGSFVYPSPDRKPRDIDVVVRSLDERPEMQGLLGSKIEEATGLDCHWVFESRGPNCSGFSLYDLVCRARRNGSEASMEQAPVKEDLQEQEDGSVTKAIAFKVPDPKFVLDRLASKKEAISLSGQSRGGIAGSPMFLVNERLKKREGIFVWAVVTFDQEPDTVSSVEALGKRLPGLDELTRREFAVRKSETEGPFHVLKIRLLKKFPKPIEIRTPPPGRGFGGLIDLSKDRLRGSVDKSVNGIMMGARAVLQLLAGRKQAIVESERLDIHDQFMILVSSDRAHGMIQLGVPRKIDIKEFKRLSPVHGMTDEDRQEEWPNEQALYFYPIKEFKKFDKPQEFDDLEAQNVVIRNRPSMLQEAFHIQGTHWVPVPSSGECPMSFPKKGRFPGSQRQVCFTKSAADVARQTRMREQADIPKLANDVLNLRPKDFPDGRCGLCRYFGDPITCKVLVGPVEAELTCDGFQGKEEGFPPYEVRDEDWLAFVGGMIKEQPYQHIVQSGHLTPEGPIVVIADTMKPKRHIFSLSKEFHIGHTCVDMETRAITKDGPKTFDMLEEGEEVFCLNPETGYLEMKPIKEIRVYPYSGKMIHWAGKKYNFMVTPNHRVFCLLDYQTESQDLERVEIVRDLVASGHTYATVQDKTGVSAPTISRWVNQGTPRRWTKMMNRKFGRFDVLEARDLVGRYKFRLPVPTGYKSCPIEPVAISSKPRRWPLPDSMSPELFLRLAGWYVSEGCSSEKYGTFSLSAFAESAKEEIQSLLSELDQKTPWRNGSFVVYSVAMAKVFAPLFGRIANEKRVPKFVKNASPDQLNLFLQTYLKGDGTVQSSGSWTATTVSPRLKDDLVEIALKLGFMPSVACRPAGRYFVIRKEYDCQAAYTIYASRRPNSVVNVSGMPRRCQEIDYTGIVWCPVIPDHENFLMERHGKYVFTGNSREHNWTQEEVDRLIKRGKTS